MLVRDRALESVSLVPAMRGEDNLVRLYSPQSDKGRELLGYLRSGGGEHGASLAVMGEEVVIEGISCGEQWLSSVST